MTEERVEFGWFIPTYGDGPTLTDQSSMVPPSNELFASVARAAEDAGFEYVLVPVAVACWEAWISTAMLVPLPTLVPNEIPVVGTSAPSRTRSARCSSSTRTSSSTVA